MALNPVVFTEKVVRSFLRYQLTAYPFADERLHAQMRRLLSLDETRQSPLMKGRTSACRVRSDRALSSGPRAGVTPVIHRVGHDLTLYHPGRRGYAAPLTVNRRASVGRPAASTRRLEAA